MVFVSNLSEMYLIPNCKDPNNKKEKCTETLLNYCCYGESHSIHLHRVQINIHYRPGQSKIQSSLLTKGFILSRNENRGRDLQFVWFPSIDSLFVYWSYWHHVLTSLVSFLYLVAMGIGS